MADAISSLAGVHDHHCRPPHGRTTGGARPSVPVAYPSFSVATQSEIGLGALANEVGGDPIPPVLTRNGRARGTQACALRDAPQPNAVGSGAGGTPSRLCGG